jgi:serine/threonine protein kinase
VANFQSEDNAKDTSGTPGYMAPEVICRRSRSYEADYFGLGVVLYELMLGRRPYLGRCRKDIRQAMLAKQVTISLPQPSWSLHSVAFVNRLLRKNPA